MVNSRQGRWSIRRRTMELLEEADVEDVMQTSSGWQGEANSDVVEELGDAVGAVEAWPQLAGDGLWQ